MAYEKKNALAVLKNMNLAALPLQKYQQLTHLLAAYALNFNDNAREKNEELLKAAHHDFWQGLADQFSLAGVDENTDDNALRDRVLMLNDVICNPTNKNILTNIVNSNNPLDTNEKKQYAAQKLLSGLIRGELKRDGTAGAENKLTMQQLEAVIGATTRDQLLRAFCFELDTPEHGQLLNNDNVIPPASIVHIRELALKQRLEQKPQLLDVLMAIQPAMDGITGEQVQFLDQSLLIAKAFENFSPLIATRAQFLQVYNVLITEENQALVEKLAQSAPPIDKPQAFLKHIADLNQRPVLKAMIENYNRASRPLKDMNQVVLRLMRAKTPAEVMAVTGSYTNANQLLQENKPFQVLTREDNDHPVLFVLKQLTSAYALNNVGKQALLEIIKSAKNYTEFKEKLKEAEVTFGKQFKCSQENVIGGVDKTFKEIFPNCETELTAFMFMTLKAESNKTLTSKERHDTLSTQETDLLDKVKKLDGLYKGIKKHIDVLKEANEYSWFYLFNPQQAKNKADAFQNLASIAEGCDVMVREYQYVMKQLTYIVNSLPPKKEPPYASWQERKAENKRQKHRETLEDQIKDLQKKCDHLQEYSQLYHGDSTKEKELEKIGLKGQIQKAQEGANKMRVLHKNTDKEIMVVRKPQTKEERNNILQPVAEDQDRERTYHFQPCNNEESKMVDILKPGEFLECVKKYPQENNAPTQYGRFALGRDKPEDIKGHRYASKPAMHVAVIEYPASTADKIDMAVRMVSKMIACLGSRVPTKDHPLHVYGSADELQYLITALILMGQKNENFKFSPDAIKIHDERLAQAMSSQYGFFGFKKGSVYKENQVTFDDRIGAELQKVQKFQTQSFGEKKVAQKQEEKIEKSTLAVNRQFKAKAQENQPNKIEEIKKEQNDRNRSGLEF